MAGPDVFGHRADSTSFETIDLIPGAAGVVTLIDNANGAAPLSLGQHRFRFFGRTYSEMYVSTAGLITFDSANASSANTNLTGLPQTSIAPLWDQWQVDAATSAAGANNDCVLYQFDSARQRVVIEWNNTGDVTFQAILRLNTGTVEGAITFNYPDLDTGIAASTAGGSATVGLKPAGAGATADKLLVHHDAIDSIIGTGKAVRIAHPTQTPGGSISGNAFWDHNAIPSRTLASR